MRLLDSADIRYLAKLPLPLPFPKRHIGLVWRRASACIRLVEALLAEAR